jgi:hypothetical protein
MNRSAETAGAGFNGHGSVPGAHGHQQSGLEPRSAAPSMIN